MIAPLNGISHGRHAGLFLRALFARVPRKANELNTYVWSKLSGIVLIAGLKNLFLNVCMKLSHKIFMVRLFISLKTFLLEASAMASTSNTASRF